MGAQALRFLNVRKKFKLPFAVLCVTFHVSPFNFIFHLLLVCLKPEPCSSKPNSRFLRIIYFLQTLQTPKTLKENSSDCFLILQVDELIDGNLDLEREREKLTN